MRWLLHPKWPTPILLHKTNRIITTPYCTVLANPALPAPTLRELCKLVSSPVGGLDELESKLSQFKTPLRSSLVRQVLESCKCEAPSRRLVRFFLWCRKNLGRCLSDEDYNYGVRVFAGMRDVVGVDIVLSDMRDDGRVMERGTFGVVVEMLVREGKDDQALGIFKNLDKFKCPWDGVTVLAIVSALCGKGHAKKAEGVVRHHRDKISGVESCVYRSLVLGWCEVENVKEARRIMKEMKSGGIVPDLFCYNSFIRGLCERNLKRNPSGLVPEALNVMMEMRSHRIFPNAISYNILFSCLGRTRRVKESCQVLELMKKAGCLPDWYSYYLVARVLYLSGRFGKGNKIVDEMFEQGLKPERKFFYDLIGVLCGVERTNYALELFERMKKCSLGGYEKVYDLLIPKLCRGGDFEKGKELWDEAKAMGVSLQCSSEILDPSVTEVFKPQRKVKEINIVDIAGADNQKELRKIKAKERMKKTKKHKRKKEEFSVNLVICLKLFDSCFSIPYFISILYSFRWHKL